MDTAAAASLSRIIAEHLGVKLNRVVDNARLRDFGADWLDCLELLMMIEDQLPELQTNELAAEQIETVGDLIRALDKCNDYAARSSISTQSVSPPR